MVKDNGIYLLQCVLYGYTEWKQGYDVRHVMDWNSVAGCQFMGMEMVFEFHPFGTCMYQAINLLLGLATAVNNTQRILHSIETVWSPDADEKFIQTRLLPSLFPEDYKLKQTRVLNDTPSWVILFFNFHSSSRQVWRYARPTCHLLTWVSRSPFPDTYNFRKNEKINENNIKSSYLYSNLFHIL